MGKFLVPRFFVELQVIDQSKKLVALHHDHHKQCRLMEIVWSRVPAGSVPTKTNLEASCSCRCRGQMHHLRPIQRKSPIEREEARVHANGPNVVGRWSMFNRELKGQVRESSGVQ